MGTFSNFLAGVTDGTSAIRASLISPDLSSRSSYSADSPIAQNLRQPSYTKDLPLIPHIAKIFVSSRVTILSAMMKMNLHFVFYYLNIFATPYTTLSKMD